MIVPFRAVRRNQNIPTVGRIGNGPQWKQKNLILINIQTG
jgi:hypothetical protein